VARTNSGSTPLLDRLPEGLSGGQKQRVALVGRSPASRSVFLMDEPLNPHLDRQAAQPAPGPRSVDLQAAKSAPTTLLRHPRPGGGKMTMGAPHRRAPTPTAPTARHADACFYKWPSNLVRASHRQPADEPACRCWRWWPTRCSLAPGAFWGGPSGQALIHTPAAPTKGHHRRLRPRNLKFAPAANRNIQAEVCHV